MDVRQHAFLARQPSAAVKPREHFLGMPKRGLAFLLANVMFWQPMWAQADGIVVANPGTSLGQAGNGVPIIQIAAPNGSGLSHNQFHDYNVGAQGVILNNVNTQTGTTQLGGIIVGNPNLVNRNAAQTILNEVVGGSPSQLRGYTEVAGQSARVIVANPYGISCNGCGFINTPRVTLTTGKPVLDGAGRLDHFQVDQGSVSIDGVGLNANNVDRFEIITRSAKINAEIQANNLTIVAGRNDVNADSLNATARANDGSAKPELAIDSSALGGMYAGSIKLVGTEAGVGVKLAGNMAASGGDIQLDVNGQLSMAQTAASGAVNVNAASLNVVGPVYAGTSVAVSTSGDVNVQQNLAARDRISLSSGGQLSNQAVIEAGVNADNSRNATGDVSVSAQNLTNTGSLIASRNLSINTAQTLTNQGGTLNGQGGAQITAATLDNRQKGRVLSQGNLAVTANQLLNSQGGLITSTGNLNVNAGSLINSGGELSSSAVSTLQVASLDNVAGLIGAGQSLSITASGQLNNQGGRVLAQRDLQISAGALDNSQQGSVVSQGTLGLNVAGTLDNRSQGKMLSGGALTAQIAGQLLNQTGLFNAGGDLRLSTPVLDNRNGEISTLGNLTLNGSQADNSGNGRLLANGDVALTLDTLNNQLKGVISGQRDVQLNARQLDNSGAGSVYAKRNLGLTLANQLNNTQGTLRGDGTLNVRSASLGNNGGSVSSLGNLTVNSDGAVTNQGGALLTDAGLTLTSGSLDNSQQGRIAGKGVVLKTGAFANQQGGRLTSTGTLQLTASQVDNSVAGRIASAMALTATVTGLDQHAGGQLFSNTDVSLDLSSGHLNNRGGLITAPGQLLLKNLNTVDNTGGEISSAKAFALAAQSLDNTNGKLISDQALIVRIDQALTNVRGLISGKGIELHAASLDNTDASISSDADLKLQVSGALLNQNGELTSAGNSTINAMSLGNAGGQVMADKRLSLTISGAVDNQAGTLGTGDGLSLHAASLDNRQAGSLVTDGNLDVTLGGLLDNQSGGTVQSKGVMNIQSASLDNRGGRLSGLNLLTLRTTTADNRGGVIRADKDLQLFVDLLDNRQQGQLTSKAGIGFTGQRLDNQGGLLSAVGLVQLQAGVVLNNAGRIASQSDLIANIDALTQQGGELVAQGTLTLSGTSLDNRRGGLVGATKALKLNVGNIDNRAGEISSQVDVDITGQQLDNSDGSKVLAGTTLGLAVANLINQNKGLLFGKTLSLNGASLNNAGGTLAGQNDLAINLAGDLDNSAGVLSSEGTLTVNAASLDNTHGSLTSADALKVATTGALNSQSGSITTDAALTLDSTSLDNRNGGLLSGKGPIRVTTGAFDNSHGGRLTSANTLDLNAAQVTNQDAGRIASAMALTATVTGLDQQGGQLLSSTLVSLDLNHGQLNNQGGLINSPGVLLLKNLNGVANQNGEISSGQAFTLDARTLDNSDNGKLISNQALTLRLAQMLSNIKGKIFAAALDVHSASLDNTDGTISSRDDLNLNVDNSFINHNGTVVADGNLLLNAATADNSLGQISAVKDITATVGNLQQQGGKLIAQGNLNLTGNNLDNRVGGLVGATGALDIKVGAIDNRGGELSTKGGLTLDGQKLDNSDSGKILAQNTLALTVDQVINRNAGRFSGKIGLKVTGTSLDNTGGFLVSRQNIDVGLGATLDNSLGLISSEGTQGVRVGTLINTNGTLSSAGTLNINSVGAISNQGGKLIANADLDLHSASLDNRQLGSITSVGAASVTTGAFDNSHSGKLNSGGTLNLNAGAVTNRDTGAIGSTGALTANVTRLDQQGGRLFSNTRLDLDLNNGQLNNQNGLISAPILVLKNLSDVANQSGEISSAQAFTLTANNLDNSNNGKLLSNQGITLRIAQALNNVKGMIAAASLDVGANTLDNSGGTLNSRGDLALSVDGLLTNKIDGLINAKQALNITSADLNNQGGQILGGTALTLNAAALDNRANGLINSGGALNLTANSLNSSDGGEVSAKGDIGLTVSALTQNGGRLQSDAGITLDLNGGDLSNNNGLINAKGPLTISRLRDLNNRVGEISSSQSFNLAGRTFDNSGGKIISTNLLGLNAGSVLNQNGLLSGWQGLDINASSLDNRNSGTLSSKSGSLGVTLGGDLLNSGGGALVSLNDLRLNAANLDNSNGGVLSSAGAQALTLSGLINNAQGGLIDSGATLSMQAITLGNAGGTVSAKQDLGFTGTTLDNTGGNLVGNAAVNLDLLGVLTNTNGKLASAGPLLVQHVTQINNQGGQLASQGSMTLLTGGLDNRNRGTVAANDLLTIIAPGAVQNSADGLIYSQNGNLSIQAASLANAKGTLQSQGALTLTTGGDIDNQSGRIIAKAGDLNISAGNLDNRGGVLASLQGAFTAHLTGVLKNGYDLNNNRLGGVTQAQRLNLTALGGIDNYGGRISAQSGDAIISTGNFDNRNGGLYAKGKVNVTGNNFDNSGDNDGQIAGQQIDLNLSGALNNRLGIIESDTTLAIKAASLDNQTGQLRALGTNGKTNFQIGGLFDNRNGTLETANYDLTLGAGNFLNAGGSLLHVGTGTFDISTPNVINAGGTLVTRGGLTISTDTWVNSGVIQAGRLSVNVNNFTQNASGQLLASDSFSGSGVNWRNEGLIASDGSLNVGLSGAYWGGGRLSSLGNLGLSGAQVSLDQATSSIAGGGDTTINVGGLLDSIGRLTSAGNLTVNAATINNYGTIGAGSDLTLATGALVNNRGLITSGGDMRLLASSFTNDYGQVYGLSNVLIGRDQGAGKADLVENRSGDIYSAQNLTINALTVNNVRDILEFTQQEKSSVVITELDCNLIPIAGCDFRSGGRRNGLWEIAETDRLKVNASSGAASFTSGGDTLINAQTLNNTSSTIAATGNMTINAGTINNTGLQEQEIVTTRTYWNYVTQIFGVIPAAAAFNQKNSPSPSATVEADLSYFISLLGGGIIQQPQTTVKSAGSSYDAVIQAGGNVLLNAAQTINNSVVRPYYAYVAAGHSKTDTGVGSGYSTPIYINSQLPPNLAQQQVNPLALPGFSLPTGQNGLFRLSGQGGSGTQASTGNAPAQNWTFGGASVALTQRDQTVPDVQARDIRLGSVTQVSATDLKLAVDARQGAGIDASASTINVTAPSSAGGINVPGHTSGAPATTVVGGVTGSNLAGQPAVVGALPASQPPLGAANPSTVPTQITSAVAQTITRVQGLPSNSGQSKPQKYLIETNPVLTDLKQFMSSDYLLSNLGYDPDNSAKRLGDGLYEQRLIQQAVVARTGLRFIDGQTSDEALFKYLMNNAVASKTELNLSLGVTLTSEQVAALTHDIVWMENAVVNGEQVLVPVLYLASANNRLAANGALIQGNDVTLIAGQDLNNAGTLRASNNLSATASNDLVNSGLVEAGNRLDLLAGNNLVNKAGGIIAGRDVTLTATRGDVINERSVTTHESGTGNISERTDFVNSAARVEAANNLTIKAGQDFNNTGGVLKSGADTTINAGRDVNLVSTEQVINGERGLHHNETVTQYGSTVDAGQSLTVNAGRDISAIASQIDAKRDVSMSAIGDLTLASAADEEHSYSKTKKVTSQEDHVSQVSTTVNAGGNITLSAGKDLDLIASRVSAGDEAYLFAGDNVNMETADNVDYSYYTKTKKGSFGKKKSTMTETETDVSVSSSVSATNKLVISAGEDFNATGAKLTSDGTLLATAGGDINLNAAEDYASQASASSKKGWTSSKSSSSEITQTRLNSTELVAKNIELKADNDISLSAAALRAEEAVKITAGNDVLIGADQETQTSSQSKSSSKGGVTVTGWLSSTQKSQQGQSTSTQSIGSDISGNSIQIKSGRDTTVEGSTLVADKDIGINAGRNLEITSAENTETSSSKSGSKKIGEIGTSWWQGATGILKTKEADEFTSTRQSGSQIASLGGNISLTAGDHYTQTASQLVVPKGDIDITAKHVDIEAGFDTMESSKTASTSRTAIGGTVSIPLLDALRGIQQMGEAAQKTSDDRMVALAAVNAAMSVNQALDAGQAMMQDPRVGVKVSVNLSNSQSNMSSSQSGSNVVGSSVVAGGNINIVSTGAGADSDINVVGSRIEGGGNVSLKADGEINLRSAQNTAHQESNNSNSGWSAGIGFGFGESNGITFELAANKGRGSSDGDDVTQTNTSIKSGNTLNLQSGGDTNIKGAVASGETVKVKVGGDLNIESLQDTSTYTSKQSSANVGVSLCIPPFCFGTSSVSGGIAQQHMQSDYASVSEQSGIKAGDGGFQVEVTGNTDLVGAVIASTDKAVADGKNTLSTGTLTSSDVKNKAEYDASSINLSGGYGGDIGRDANGNASATASRGGPVVASKNGVSVTTPIVLFASGDSSSTTHSGISGAAVTITNTVKQQELTGQTAEQAVAAINTDVSTDRDGSNKLKPIFDAQEIGVDFEIVGKFVQNVSQFIENKAREIDQKKDLAKKEKAASEDKTLSVEVRSAHLENYVQLSQQIKEIGDNWGAGGTYRQIATALVAGISGSVTGTSAQFAQNMVVNYVQQQGSAYIGELVKKGLKEGSPEHAALHAILGCAGAAASNQSCSAGALGGSAASVLAGLFADSDPNETAIEREAKRNIITSLVTGIAAMSNPNGAATANNAATANVDNNWLATQQYVQAKKEIDAEPNVLKKLEIAVKWGITSLRQDLLTGSGILKGFTDGMAGAGLGTLDSAVSFMTDPVQSLKAAKEFAYSDEAKAMLGEAVVAALKSQIDQIGTAVVEGGDVNAENLGNQLGQVVAIVAQLMMGGGTSSADKALKLSEMGIDVSVSTVKKASASVDINAVKTQITKLEGVMRDSDVPVLDPPVVPPKPVKPVTPSDPLEPVKPVEPSKPDTPPKVEPDTPKNTDAPKSGGTGMTPVFRDPETGLNSINPIVSTNVRRIEELALDPDTQKIALHEGQAAVQLENTFGSTLKRMEPILGQPNPDFVFVDGPYAGKTVDFMWTDASRVEPLNKFFVNNAKTNYEQLIKHIDKADIVPLDYRNLTLDNQRLVTSWIEGLPAASKDKILILR